MRSQEGLFIFPKSKLIKEGIMASSNKSGKRGFRVYSTWDIPTSKQAIRAQQWQIKFFSDITDIDRIHKLIKE